MIGLEKNSGQKEWEPRRERRGYLNVDDDAWFAYGDYAVASTSLGGTSTSSTPPITHATITSKSGNRFDCSNFSSVRPGELQKWLRLPRCPVFSANR